VFSTLYHNFWIWNMLLRFGGTVRQTWFNHLNWGVKLFGQTWIHVKISSEKFNLFRSNGTLTIAGSKCHCTLGWKFYQTRLSGIALISDQRTLSTTHSGI
jgi:hypothetical protein